MGGSSEARFNHATSWRKPVAQLEVRLSITYDLSGRIIFFVNETHLTQQKVTQMTQIVQVVRPTSNADIVLTLN